jgi:heptosyltransferase-3
MSPSDTVLVLFPGALGDFICWLPALCGLRRRHRGAMLLVARPTLLDLVRFGGTAGASIDRREFADLFTVSAPLAPQTSALLRGFATVYSWTGFGNAIFARRIAEATGGAVHVFGLRAMQEGEHAAEYYVRCTGCADGAAVASVLVEDAEWFASFAERHQFDGRAFLLMHPGSGSTMKNWQGFEAIARCWREHGCGAVVVLSGPAEMESPPAPFADSVAVGGLSLPQVVALLRRSSVYLGNDSGISHLAGAAGARGVVVFGPTDPRVWAPRSEALRVLHAANPCGRCPPDVFCVHRLPVEAVLEVLRRQRTGSSIQA